MSDAAWLDEIQASIPPGDDRHELINQLRQIDADWEAMKRLMKEMGLRDFIRAALLMSKSI